MSQDLVFLDSEIIDRHLVQRGWTLTDFSNRMDGRVSSVKASGNYKSLQRIRQRRGVQRHIAYRIAATLETNVMLLLAPWDRLYTAPIHDGEESEWKHEAYLERGRLVSNGLFYICCRKHHRFDPQRLARCKCYFLNHLRPSDRDTLIHALSRHAIVAARVGQHPNVASNLSSHMSQSRETWWVTDAWVGEKTLGDICVPGGPSLTVQQQVRVLLHVARGIEAVHSAGIVVREFSLSSVLLTDDLSRAVVTDFELAKLPAGGPSVSGSWPETRYRAPEIDGKDALPSADVYSFAVVALATLNQGLPRAGQEAECVNSLAVPRPLKNLLIQGLIPSPQLRLQSISPFIPVLERWEGDVNVGR
ncbi:MAG: protein kinase [Planctomyces sp.]|nr:protein kinase [Planctomyces sp.]